MTNREDAVKLYSDLAHSGLNKDQMILRAILGVLLQDPEPISWPDSEDRLTAAFEDGKIAGQLRTAKAIAELWQEADDSVRKAGNPVGESIQFGTILKANLKLWLLANGITEEELT